MWRGQKEGRLDGARGRPTKLFISQVTCFISILCLPLTCDIIMLASYSMSKPIRLIFIYAIIILATCAIIIVHSKLRHYNRGGFKASSGCHIEKRTTPSDRPCFTLSKTARIGIFKNSRLKPL